MDTKLKRIFVNWMIMIGILFSILTVTMASYNSNNANTMDYLNINLKDEATNDTTAPSIPGNLTVNKVSGAQVNLSWTDSTDNVGVNGYRVYRNGIMVGTSTTTRICDTTASPATTYTYTVTAYDTDNNESLPTAGISVTTGGIYYVSPTSTSMDWSAARDINLPCTVHTAFDNARAGDIVQFRGGLYKLPANTTGDWLSGYYAPNYSGTEEAQIVFMAYPGEIPVFDGTSGGVDIDGHGYGHFARIMSNTRYIGSGSKTYHEYITFDGFTFQCDGGLNEGKITLTGGNNSSTKPRVRGLIVQNCTFNGGTWDNEARVNNTGTGDNHEGIFVSQTTGLIIRNCRIFDYASANNNMNTSAIKTYHSDNMIIEHCEIYDCSHGIYSKSNTDSLTVRFCYIHDNNVGFYAGSDGWWNDANDHSKGYFAIENSDNVLYHNVFSNNIRGSICGFTQGGGDLDGFVCYNNTIFAVTGYTASVGLGSGERQQFYNNIQYGPKIDNDVGLLKWYCSNNNAQDVADGMAEFNFGLDSEDHNQFGDLVNNFMIRVKKPNETTVTYLTLAAWQSSGVLTDGGNPGEGSLTSNPLFANVSGNMNTIADFALKDGSPCKGAGRDGVDMGADISQVGVRNGSPGGTTVPSVPTHLIGTAISSSVINLTWTASTDDVGVIGYRIYRNGGYVGTSVTNSYSDTGLTAATNYRYNVASYNANGNESARCATVNVTTLASNKAPTVNIGSPSNNAQFTAPAAIHITANAFDSDGTISKVEFYNGSTRLATDTTTPYSFQWSNVPAGSYTLTAVATDNKGLSTTTTPIHLTVNKPVNHSPVMTSIGNQVVLAGLPLALTVKATDADSDPLTYSATNLPPGAGFDRSTHIFSWTPTQGQVGDYTVTFSVSDGEVTVSELIKITVNTNTFEGDGLTGYYYDRADFKELRMIRNDRTVDMTWPSSAPHASMGSTTFSVRWVGQIQPLYTETYTFSVNSDDGARLWVNGKLIVDAWTAHSLKTYRGKITLTAGKSYSIRLDYYQRTGTGVVQLQWSSKSQGLQIIPAERLAPKLAITPPTPPVNVKVDKMTSSSLELTWDKNVSGTVKYRIYASRTSGFVPAAKYLAGEVTGNSFVPANLRANTVYYYRITAVDASNNESPKTAQITARTLTVTPPSNVRASHITTSSLNLAWDDSDGNVVKYRVYASLTKGFTPDSKTLKGEVTTRSFNCVNLKANAVYYIRISALDVAGNESAKTAQFTVRTLPVTPPTNVRVGNITGTSLELAWDAGNADTVKYRIYASRIADFIPGSKTLVGEETGNSFVCTNLRTNTTYYIRVSALDIAGNESVKTKTMKARTNTESP